MVIELNGVTKIIRGNRVTDNVTLRLESGHVYGLFGINGCGKTMLMRLISGLIRPTAGTVTVDGKALGREIAFPESMGLLIENPSFLTGYTGLENLRLLASLSGRASEEMLNTALQRVGLNPSDKRKYRKFSLGMKQRLGIACAIMEQPALLILDEPTNSLDSSGVSQIQALITEERNRGALIVLTCHDRTVLEAVSDVIYTIESGRITNRSVRSEEGAFS